MDLQSMHDSDSNASITPRICVCVMMNHPFPAVIPMLRRLYADRFSHLRFLIPFERSDDQDVITVYRGSYNHAAYLQDAAHELRGIDCDYFLVVHDDVLLNPKLRESNFLDVFPIGLDDGFIAEMGAMPTEFGAWEWNAAFLPRTLFPKSLLFGSGVELANLKRYMPDRRTIAAAMEKNGVRHTDRLGLDPAAMWDMRRHPAHILLYGLSHAAPVDAERHVDIEARSLDIMRALTEVLGKALEQADGSSQGPTGATSIDLPFPVAASGYFADCYVLPKSRFDDFSHYMGVASAANLFVELMVPTLLNVCCERVHTAESLGLDLSGFHHARTLNVFCDEKVIAIHPVKLSQFLQPEAQESFFEDLREVAAWTSADEPLAARGWGPGARHRGKGWHGGESWGAWSAEAEADIQIALVRPADVKLKLRAPTHPNAPPTVGSLRYLEIGNVEQSISVRVAWPDSIIEIEVPGLMPDGRGMGVIVLENDSMIIPSEFGAADVRLLGFGLMEVVATARPSLADTGHSNISEEADNH